jgi:hypothetical protein
MEVLETDEEFSTYHAAATSALVARRISDSRRTGRARGARPPTLVSRPIVPSTVHPHRRGEVGRNSLQRHVHGIRSVFGTPSGGAGRRRSSGPCPGPLSLDDRN